METHYQKEHRLKDHYHNQPEAAKYETSLKDKENLFKEIYSNMGVFKRLLYEAIVEK